MGENRVHFEQSENFSNLLFEPFASNLDGDTKRGFVAMNETLKARAEALKGAKRARLRCPTDLESTFGKRNSRFSSTKFPLRHQK